MKNIEMIFFDLGGVLVHVDVEKLYVQMADVLGRSHVAVKAFAEDRPEILEKFERGLVSGRDFYRTLCQPLEVPVSFDQFRLAYSDIFTLIEPVVALAQNLKSRYRLSIISNTDAWHYQFIMEHFSQLAIFEAPITSFEVHSLKPEEEIYRAALTRFRVEAEEALFIDDKIENVHGAQRIGMHAVQYIEPDQLKSELKTMGIKIDRS